MEHETMELLVACGGSKRKGKENGTYPCATWSGRMKPDDSPSYAVDFESEEKFREAMLHAGFSCGKLGWAGSLGEQAVAEKVMDDLLTLKWRNFGPGMLMVF